MVCSYCIITEKVKDIDAYFAKLKEFSLSHRTDTSKPSDSKDDE